MTEITFPVSSADAIVNFYRTEILTGQEAKHFSKNDLTPVPKVEFVNVCVTSFSWLSKSNRNDALRSIKAVLFLESGLNFLLRQLNRNTVRL